MKTSQICFRALAVQCYMTELLFVLSTQNILPKEKGLKMEIAFHLGQDSDVSGYTVFLQLCSTQYSALTTDSTHDQPSRTMLHQAYSSFLGQFQSRIALLITLHIQLGMGIIIILSMTTFMYSFCEYKQNNVCVFSSILTSGTRMFAIN